jgi:hypothetical protein
MEQARGPGAEADEPEEEEEEAEKTGVAMAAVVTAAGPAVLQVAGLYRGLCAVRSRGLGLGFVSPAQLRVFPVRCGSGRPPEGADGKGVGSELEANPFYDRYRDKIQQLRRCGPSELERTGHGAGGGGLRPELLGLRAALRGGHWACPHSTNSVQKLGHLLANHRHTAGLCKVLALCTVAFVLL